MRRAITFFADPGLVLFDDDPREGPDSEFPHDEFACLDANTCSNDGGCEFLNLLRRHQVPVLREGCGMKYQRKPFPKMPHTVDSRAGGPIPVGIIAERDWRRAQPKTIHMHILGDPEVGRSMLDQRRIAEGEAL